MDDKEGLERCGDYPVRGTSGRFKEFDCDMAVAIGNAEIRQSVQEKLESAGKRVPVLIHPSAVVAEDVKIGAGSVIMAGAVINTGSVIGKGCIINTCASVDHDCRLADYVHVSVGAHLAGTVTVGNRTWIGVGAAVSNNLDIADGCMIGAGAVAVRSIGEAGTYAGVPARRI